MTRRDASAEAQPTLGTRALRGVIWAYGAFVGGRILTLAATVVLARVLTPEDFGLVALAITMMALLEGVSDLGLSTALAISPEAKLERRAQTVFVTSLILGFTLSVVIAALSPLAAGFFNEPELAGLATALGFNFFIGSLGSTQFAMAQKRLDFRSRTFAEIAEVITRGVLSIALALAGFGAWSLVLGYLAGTTVRVIALWMLVDFRPTMRVDRTDLREMIGYAGTISGVNVVATVIANIDYVFVGRVLGAASLGLYTIAFRLPELLVLNVSMVAAQVLVPAFSSVEPEELGRTFLVSLRYTLLVALPLALGLAILAEPIVLTLFGEQWTAAASVMPILVIYAFAVTVGVPAGAVYKGTGRAGILLALGLVRLALLVGALVLFVSEGTVAAALCQAAVAVAAEIVGIGLASRLLGVGLGTISRAVAPLLVAAAGMAGVLFGLDLLIEGNLASLAVAAPAGALTYLALVAVLAPDAVTYLRGKLKPGAVAQAGQPPIPESLEAEPTPYNVPPPPQK